MAADTSCRRIFIISILAILSFMMYGLLSKVHINVVTNVHEPDAVSTNNEAVTVVIPMEEIKARARRKAMQPLLGENIAPDDPRLIQAIRDHFIDPPARKMAKMSRSLVVTPQAKRITEILKGKKNGFYIECGALDGERSSNSIYFEQKHNWKGILIEMDPSWYRQLEGKNRKAFAMNACLSPKTYPIKMEFKEFFDGRGQLWTSNKGKDTSSVYCFPLYSIMLALNRTHIDYFSLDVEGFELDILKTIPFDKLDITTLSVEYAHAPKGKQEYLDFMTSKGYTVNAKLGSDAATWVQDYIFIKNDTKT